MQRIITTFIASAGMALSLLSCQSNEPAKTMDYTKLVNPYIGTDLHGHVFLGANVPFGAVQVGPTNYIKGWDWCSGYHYSDSISTGFAQTHLSGTGIGDLGDVLITPYTGALKLEPGSIKDPLSGYASKYSHLQEVAEPGYYKVQLLSYDIKAELTASERVAFHKYTFPENSASHIAINLNLGIGWDTPTKVKFKLVNDSTITGYRFSKGWAVDQRLYFAIKLSKPIKNTQIFNNQCIVKQSEIEADSLVAILTFPTKASEQLLLKVGISPVSEENALLNIDREISHWDFTKTVSQAKEKWNNELSKVAVSSGNINDLKTFYTALYHTFTTPFIFNDNNKDYRGTDMKVYQKASFTNYSVFSLWDTYRAAHPLYTIVQPERVNDMVQSMLAIYQQQGKLPIWPLNGSETNCMVGYSAIPVITDAIMKGFDGFDQNLAYSAMKASSMRDDLGVNYLKTIGYVPCDKEKESVSKALEYAISDWCIAQIAQKNQDQKNAEYYQKRGQAYAQYFDPKTGFMRAKMFSGQFREPFNPFQSTHEWGDYTEGNAWQYTWLVPQDVPGLINLFGGDANFTAKLDSLFIVTGNMGDKASPDISGLIGMYAHGNEPGHHIPYLYAYVGEQWKSAELVRKITTEMYNDQETGLCGNEDCGQMSAWYVLSSLGFYQVNPANGVFVLGSPLFDNASIKLPNGKTFKLKCINNSHTNKYIQEVKLNGVVITRSYILYNEIMNGANLEITMGSEPNKAFGSNIADRPQTVLQQ